MTSNSVPADAIDKKARMGAEIMARANALALVSEVPGQLTRRYLTPEHARANTLVGDWMSDAGMTVRIDAVGNVVGRYEAKAPGRPALFIGSHLDTVADAGRYDGMLGVITAITCIRALFDAGQRFDFAIEVIGFCDEEGLRYQSTLLGSRAVAGKFDTKLLSRTDDDGIAMADAMRTFGLDPARTSDAARQPEDVLAYVELHIEQGPVLEANGRPVGVVTSIAGATRLAISIDGVAGHAGTVPMGSRHDALAAAAEVILTIEERCRLHNSLVGTVGTLSVLPGATNVIPGRVAMTADIRAADDPVRLAAVADICAAIGEISANRGVSADIRQTHASASSHCAPWLTAQIAAAIGGDDVIHLPSGAGHDAAAMAELTDVGMIFVRCTGGISHNPAEHISEGDAEAGAQALLNFIRHFSKDA